ncbi:hypothetical protein, partial [Sphingomonas bacterium]|uniref:hypothetical protein n=1 Tax=Sphingomonas bacterium TaxID=1895847 RepID=UPI0015776560
MSNFNMTLERLEPRALLSATLTAGQTVITGIHTAGVQKNYQFNLVAGQAFVIAAGDNSSTFTTEIVLFGPNGRAIARSSGADGGFIGKVIPTTGKYDVRILDITNNHTASVTLTAFYSGASTITDSDDAGAIQ